MSASDYPPVPATFEFLVFSLKMQAEVRMGILSIPGEGAEAPDLGAARHAIDTLAMLQEKTRGNLTLEEQRLIENSLTELRFRFVQASDMAKQAAKTNEASSSESKASESKTESGGEAAPESGETNPK